MSTQINQNILRNFIFKTVGSEMSKNKAEGLGIKSDVLEEADVNTDNYLDLDEILDNTDLYEQFATMYVEENDKAEAKDKEKEEDEQNKVHGKNGSAQA